MGYEFTMYPCNNQACTKGKHFKLLLSPDLAKRAWLQHSLVPWLPVPCSPAAGRTSLHSHPTPPAPSSPGHSPRGGPSAVGGWCSPCDPNLSLPCHRTGKVLRKGWAFLMLSFCPFILWQPKRKGIPKTGGERMEAKVRWIFPGPSQIYSILFTLRRTGLSHIPSALWVGFCFD